MMQSSAIKPLQKIGLHAIEQVRNRMQSRDMMQNSTNLSTKPHEWRHRLQSSKPNQMHQHQVMLHDANRCNQTQCKKVKVHTLNRLATPSLSCSSLLYWDICPQAGMRAYLLQTSSTASSICSRNRLTLLAISLVEQHRPQAASIAMLAVELTSQHILCLQGLADCSAVGQSVHCTQLYSWISTRN